MLKNDVQVYGAERCHKTCFYLDLLKKENIKVDFFDVEKNQDAAQDLRNLYITGKLNFPTILIKGKKLRNPSSKELEKWLKKKEIKS